MKHQYDLDGAESIIRQAHNGTVKPLLVNICFKHCRNRPVKNKCLTCLRFSYFLPEKKK